MVQGAVGHGPSSVLGGMPLPRAQEEVTHVPTIQRQGLSPRGAGGGRSHAGRSQQALPVASR